MIVAPTDLLTTRTRYLNAQVQGRGSFVLYWMRVALRATENPALEVALRIANAQGLPLFVYHAVSERYPYASDRHHTFILEGSRDVARQLNERGIGTAFHCERPGMRGPYLRHLAERAAAVVTEEMPVSPLRMWTRRLADHLDGSVPMSAVDTATVVPMRVVGKGIDRAFAYRERVTPLLNSYLSPVADIAATRPATVPDLPFEPIDWSRWSIDALVAACEIDHTVGPVPETRGGSTAGYARWEAFKASGLRPYHGRRNDPMRAGTSRMSAYLHYGMVAPTRLARECRSVDGPGAKKFLDELVVWRELAYTWCLYAAEHESLAALPQWARDTLQAHASDTRESSHTLETLTRAKTGNGLWDAAQQSLLRHGELHNNLRMSWGKAIVAWTNTPEDALDALVDLNHRYALDGRDPASYGGLLWCAGQFDRPFPESTVFGRVRARSIEAHAARVDVDGFRAHVSRPIVSNPPRFAVIGGGPAGAIAARTLVEHGIPTTVFDKARGPGGRMSRRRSGDGRHQYDHGAQYMTFRDARLKRLARLWERQGCISPWQGPFGTWSARGFIAEEPSATRYVGQPGMNGLVRHLLADVPTHFSARVVAVQRTATGWVVHGAEGTLGEVDGVLVATPTPQALPLLAGHPFADTLRDVEVAPCWTVMARPTCGDFDWSAARVEGNPVGWVARNQTKPGRPDGEQWVLQANAAWSALHLEDDPGRVAEALVAAIETLPGLHGLRFEDVVAHRWRYAQVTRPVGVPCLYDPELLLGVCGDGLLGGRVESALESGMALAGRVLGRLSAGSSLGWPEPTLFGGQAE
ncbi:MAG: NAD(P)-binding protein [Rhodobacterales bacterium]|nr:NAD(P)-binding protein [Rhodobacterales bacterium]